jgi:hypothetical protein
MGGETLDPVGDGELAAAAADAPIAEAPSVEAPSVTSSAVQAPGGDVKLLNRSLKT